MQGKPGISYLPGYDPNPSYLFKSPFQVFTKSESILLRIILGKIPLIMRMTIVTIDALIACPLQQASQFQTAAFSNTSRPWSTPPVIISIAGIYQESVCNAALTPSRSLF
ncbi:hypothetical protein WAE56_08690 [Iodobacter sp. LRB]|uniref:hypothetical protein n=1 Tax=unclassified Iodobacter TaxID=235634 RepID=UPI0015D4EDB0|nr:hypothetical protein [Iodobacter sp. BJB302]